MRFCFFLVFVLSLCVTARADDVQVRAAFERAAFERTVKDMATWDFAPALKDSNWVVAEVIPQPGHYEIVKEPRSKWDGVAIVPNNTPVVWIVDGAVKVLEPLGAASEKTLWSYHSERKGRTFRTLVGSESPLWGTERRERYSPFYRQPGGIVLCSLPDAIRNAETDDPQYQRAYLLPADTLRWVKPAQTFYQANPELFSPGKATINKYRLLKLTEDENPFLFAAAFRTLIQAGLMESPLLTQRLAKADRFRQAVFTYSLLYYSSAKAGKALVEAIYQAIDKAQNSNQLEGLAIGARLAHRTLYDFDHRTRARPFFRETLPALPAPPPSLALSESLLRTLSEKLKTFGIRTETDKVLLKMLGPYSALAPPPTRTVDTGVPLAAPTIVP